MWVKVTEFYGLLRKTNNKSLLLRSVENQIYELKNCLACGCEEISTYDSGQEFSGFNAETIESSLSASTGRALKEITVIQEVLMQSMQVLQSETLHVQMFSQNVSESPRNGRGCQKKKRTERNLPPAKKRMLQSVQRSPDTKQEINDDQDIRMEIDVDIIANNECLSDTPVHKEYFLQPNQQPIQKDTSEVRLDTQEDRIAKSDEMRSAVSVYFVSDIPLNLSTSDKENGQCIKEAERKIQDREKALMQRDHDRGMRTDILAAENGQVIRETEWKPIDHGKTLIQEDNEVLRISGDVNDTLLAEVSHLRVYGDNPPLHILEDEVESSIRDKSVGQITRETSLGTKQEFEDGPIAVKNVADNPSVLGSNRLLDVSETDLNVPSRNKLVGQSIQETSLEIKQESQYDQKEAMECHDDLGGSLESNDAPDMDSLSLKKELGPPLLEFQQGIKQPIQYDQQVIIGCDDDHGLNVVSNPTPEVGSSLPKEELGQPLQEFQHGIKQEIQYDQKEAVECHDDLRWSLESNAAPDMNSSSPRKELGPPLQEFQEEIKQPIQYDQKEMMGCDDGPGLNIVTNPISKEGSSSPKKEFDQPLQEFQQGIKQPIHHDQKEMMGCDDDPDLNVDCNPISKEGSSSPKKDIGQPLQEFQQGIKQPIQYDQREIMGCDDDDRGLNVVTSLISKEDSSSPKKEFDQPLQEFQQWIKQPIQDDQKEMMQCNSAVLEGVSNPTSELASSSPKKDLGQPFQQSQQWIKQESQHDQNQIMKCPDGVLDVVRNPTFDVDSLLRENEPGQLLQEFQREIKQELIEYQNCVDDQSQRFESIPTSDLACSLPKKELSQLVQEFQQRIQLEFLFCQNETIRFNVDQGLSFGQKIECHNDLGQSVVSNPTPEMSSSLPKKVFGESSHEFQQGITEESQANQCHSVQRLKNLDVISSPDIPASNQTPQSIQKSYCGETSSLQERSLKEVTTGAQLDGVSRELQDLAQETEKSCMLNGSCCKNSCKLEKVEEKVEKPPFVFLLVVREEREMKEQVQLFCQMFSATIVDEATEDITHVITLNAGPSLEVILGLVMEWPVMQFDWIADSLEKCALQPESPYIVDFSYSNLLKDSPLRPLNMCIFLTNENNELRRKYKLVLEKLGGEVDKHVNCCAMSHLIITEKPPDDRLLEYWKSNSPIGLKVCTMAYVVNCMIAHRWLPSSSPGYFYDSSEAKSPSGQSL